jgi:SAM-dependent methyltransferase
MDLDLVERIMDGIFSRSLQVRRMLRRGATDVMAQPLSEIAALARRVEAGLSPEQLADGASAVERQQLLTKPTIEVGLLEGYTKWAPGYDDEANPLIPLEEPVVLDVVGEVAGKAVLDAACGTGRYSFILAQRGATVSGIDASADMLAQARRKADQLGVAVDLRLGDIARLPFAADSFDLAVCALAFCHLPDLRPAIRELARVTRPGGRLIVSDFHPFCLLVGWRTAFDRPEATYCIENHLNLTERYVRALLDAGFTLTDLRESVVDERAAGILSEVDIERFRGYPAALVIEGTLKEEK